MVACPVVVSFWAECRALEVRLLRLPACILRDNAKTKIRCEGRSREPVSSCCHELGRRPALRFLNEMIHQEDWRCFQGLRPFAPPGETHLRLIAVCNSFDRKRRFLYIQPVMLRASQQNACLKCRVKENPGRAAQALAGFSCFWTNKALQLCFYFLFFYLLLTQCRLLPCL